MANNNGGPAFPVNNYGMMNNSYSGMSLRDYFAAHASDNDIRNIISNTPGLFNRQKARYIHADEMLQAREEE